MGVKWTDEALDHIAQIYDYIAKDSPFQAGKFVDKLIDSVNKQLAVSLHIGHELPDGNDPNLCRIVYKNYRVIYYIQGDSAHIWHIENCARELTKERINEIKDRNDR